MFIDNVWSNIGVRLFRRFAASTCVCISIVWNLVVVVVVYEAPGFGMTVYLIMCVDCLFRVEVLQLSDTTDDRGIAEKAEVP